MRKLFFALSFLFSVLVFKQADAQLSISFNISSQPKWGPVGYNYVQYYYFPDIDCYYYVPTKQFVYLSGGEWIHSVLLPPMYRNYNLYNGYKVVINEPHPYLNHSYYHNRYASYRGRIGQSIIRDSRDPRYRPGYRPGNNRPPVKPKPPGNGGIPTRPGNGNKPGQPGVVGAVRNLAMAEYQPARVILENLLLNLTMVEVARNKSKAIIAVNKLFNIKTPFNYIEWDFYVIRYMVYLPYTC
jgi:hypothetical protein